MGSPDKIDTWLWMVWGALFIGASFGVIAFGIKAFADWKGISL